MIDVRIQIRDSEEYHLLTLFVSALDAKRGQQREAFVAAHTEREETAPPEQHERPAHPDDAPPTVQGKVVGSIAPKPAAAPTLPETEMAAVVQKSLDGRGLAKTREIIAPITGGKRWRESDPAVWPAIKAALEAE